MKQSRFFIWVKEFGVDNLAQQCGVGPHQVRVWLRGKALPRSTCIQKINELSKINVAEIVYETTRAK